MSDVTAAQPPTTAPAARSAAGARALDLSQDADLTLFLEGVAAVHDQALQFRAVAESDGYQRVAVPDVPGAEIFTTVSEKLTLARTLADTCRQRILLDEPLPDTLIDQIQTAYNDVVLLRNHIRDVYQVTTPPASSANIVPQTAAIASAELTKVTESAEAAAQFVKSIRVNLFALFPKSERVGTVREHFKELSISQKRIDELHKKIKTAAQKGEAVEPAQLEKCQKIIEEIRGNVTTLQTALEQRQAKEEAAANSDQPPTKATRPHPKSTQDSQPTPPTAVPSSAEATALVQQIKHNQFYTSDEKATAAGLLATFEQALASRAPEAALRDHYYALKQHCKQLETPTAETLVKRAAHILSRIQLGAADQPTLLETAEALEEQVALAASEAGSTLVAVRAAYQELEDFAYGHETQWQMICGAHLPSAGPIGIPAVETLLQTLVAARKEHPALRDDVERQVLVDTLIQHLRAATTTGLKTPELHEVRELARLIDCPQPYEQSAVAATPVAGRKTMQIESDQAEGEVAIDVADEAKVKTISFTPQSVATGVPPPNAATEPPLASSATPPADVLPAPTHPAVVATAEQQDPINTAVPAGIPQVQKSAPALQRRSLTAEYLLNTPAYREFITTNYTSPEAFERMLDVTVTTIESHAIDSLERWLGETYASAFLYLQDKTVAEIVALSKQGDVRTTLREANVKYEVFIEWIDQLPEMQAVVGRDDQLTLGELYARWMIELQIDFVANQTE